MQHGLENGAPIISGMFWSSKHNLNSLHCKCWFIGFSFTGPFSNHLCWKQEPVNCTNITRLFNNHNQRIARKRVYFCSFHRLFHWINSNKWQFYVNWLVIYRKSHPLFLNSSKWKIQTHNLLTGLMHWQWRKSTSEADPIAIPSAILWLFFVLNFTT